MHIVIYGVGRSGTKAIQLYLAYLLARKENEVWINYEPHLWHNRKTRHINYEGFYHHTNTPHLLDSTNKLSIEHQNFLKKLASHKCSIVSKFIRSNGRIDAITEVLKPDFNFIVIRDLYEVLPSVLKTEWDFWSVGLDYVISWENFIKEIGSSGIVKNFDWCMSRITDRIDRNAFYWYVMNLAALSAKTPNTFLIDYRNIGIVETISRNYIWEGADYSSIRSEKFSGDNLHQDYPLMSSEKLHYQKDFLNLILYKTQLFSKRGWLIKVPEIGSLVKPSHALHSPTKKLKETTLIVERKELFDFFNDDIYNRMNDAISKQTPVENILLK
jgi:hypothetical protein